jgi:stress response protein YsnF
MEERVEVGTTTAPAGVVRVRIEIEDGRERVAVADVREEYQPSVRAVGEPATARRDPYFDGDELVVPVYEERVVVERRLFLKEEIRLRRARHVVHEEREVPVRRERAVFERLQDDGSWREVPLAHGAPVAGHSTPDPSAAARE